MNPTPKPKQVSRHGITTDSPMPPDLPYAAALRLLMADRDHYSVNIGIDPAQFYSTAPIELHDFVDSIVYRFVTEEGAPFLAYEIVTRQGGRYREVAFDGTVLQEWAMHVILIGVPDELAILQARSDRTTFTLGSP